MSLCSMMVYFGLSGQNGMVMIWTMAGMMGTTKSHGHSSSVPKMSSMLKVWATRTAKARVTGYTEHTAPRRWVGEIS